MIEPFHLLSIDVEDWPQSTLDQTLPITTRVVTNTHTLLELPDESGVRIASLRARGSSGSTRLPRTWDIALRIRTWKGLYDKNPW